jgi:hypothetical protein
MADLVPDYDELDDDELLEDEDNENDIEFDEEPLFTYALHDDNTCSGFVDNLDAIKQLVRLILDIERYDHTIYDWDYGSELKQLFGMSTDYCVPEIERLITEALTADERIEAVDNFEFEISKRSILVKFTVHTEYGDAEMEQEINV